MEHAEDRNIRMHRALIVGCLSVLPLIGCSAQPETPEAEGDSQSNIIIITQPFHSYRALFISNYYDINALALVADEPAQKAAPKVFVREYFARTKAVLDLYVLRTEPRHLGEKEPIAL